MPFVVGHDDTVVHQGDGGDDRVEGAARLTDGPALRHEVTPGERRTFVEGQDPAGEKRLRTFRSERPDDEAPVQPFGQQQQSRSA